MGSPSYHHRSFDPSSRTSSHGLRQHYGEFQAYTQSRVIVMHSLVRLLLAVGRSDPVWHGSIIARSPRSPPRRRTHRSNRSSLTGSSSQQGSIASIGGPACGRSTPPRGRSSSPRVRTAAGPARSVVSSCYCQLRLDRIERACYRCCPALCSVRVTSLAGPRSYSGPNEPENGNLMSRVASLRDFRPISQLSSI